MNRDKDFDLCVAEEVDANVSSTVKLLQRELRDEHFELAKLLAEAGYMVPPEIILGYRCGRKRLST